MKVARRSRRASTFCKSADSTQGVKALSKRGARGARHTDEALRRSPRGAARALRIASCATRVEDSRDRRSRTRTRARTKDRRPPAVHDRTQRRALLEPGPLQESSQKIAEIIGVIDSIAFRTQHPRARRGGRGGARRRAGPRLRRRRREGAQPRPAQRAGGEELAEAVELAARGIATLRYPFPYIERGAKRLLGKDAQSAVRLAYDPQLDREVAMKTLHPGRGDGRDGAGAGGDARKLRLAVAVMAAEGALQIRAAHTGAPAPVTRLA